MTSMRSSTVAFYTPQPDLLRWGMVYKRLYARKPDFSGLYIPTKPEGVGPVRLIVVARELLDWTGNRPLKGAHERDPKSGSYVVWVKDVREADEEYANKSAIDLEIENHIGITELEYALLRGDYFFEKGEHLDQENATLCLGSRRYSGSVPFAYWYRGKSYIHECSPSFHLPQLRSRRVWA